LAVVVTRKGKEIIATRMRGAPASSTEPLNVGWGTGGLAGGPFTAANPDVGFFSESAEARVAGTSSLVTTTVTNDTYQVVGTITATGTRTITEVGLSDSATKPFSTTVAAGGTANGSSSGTGLNTAASYTPANGTQIQVRTEVLTVTAGSGSTALTVTRGVNGSTAIATIATGDQVTAGNMPGQTGVTNGNFFLHADHAANGLSTNDSIQYTIQVQFT
jgi:hypothetical protein